MPWGLNFQPPPVLPERIGQCPLTSLFITNSNKTRVDELENMLAFGKEMANTLNSFVFVAGELALFC